MRAYELEFLTVAGAHLLAVMSPGPDFAIVVKQSLRHGRRLAVWTSIGIACGILLHVSYSLLGIGLLIKSSPWAFTVLKFAGAAYLAWIGVNALRARASQNALQPGGEAVAPLAAGLSARAAWNIGFFTNALNPKATLFFLALFSVVIDPHTPRWVQAGYGAWMAVATGAWFTLVSFFFTREKMRRVFLQHGHWVDRVMGVVLLGFAVRLALATVG
ncbi:LysE family transporter [Horticoccus luteus]|uniref:LysE family transporter n=1 Tax=Horticoccus luteus TaxID=2862869 RepID=A0A8F9XKC9_9BACT|nr:LysE family transporter [Horticoccus luteus]QYM78071.1 LysE family transporter [Horticoccus luteus]